MGISDKNTGDGGHMT